MPVGPSDFGCGGERSTSNGAAADKSMSGVAGRSNLIDLAVPSEAGAGVCFPFTTTRFPAIGDLGAAALLNLAKSFSACPSVGSACPSAGLVTLARAGASSTNLPTGVLRSVATETAAGGGLAMI